MEGIVIAKKAFMGMIPRKVKLLEGTEEKKNVFQRRSHFVSQVNL